MVEEVAIETVEQEYLHWPTSKFKDPIDVDNGIRLQKAPSSVATQWWSKKWLDIIMSFGLGVRFQRAMMYASRGQVLKIEIENGLVKACVQGSDPEPYRVIIAAKTIPKAIWTSILQELGQESRFAISLTSGEMPPEEELQAAFRNSGALLFPDRQGELQTKCSCPDWSNPCKHVAAVYLLLAAEFDRDPFLIFKLRGLSHDELFFLLSTQYDEGGGHGALTSETTPAASSPETAIDCTSAAQNTDTAQATSSWQGSDLERESAGESSSAVADNTSGAPEISILESKVSSNPFDPGRYWRCSLEAQQIFGEWQPAPVSASLAASLGDFPFWQSREDLMPALKRVYEEATPQAIEMLCRQDPENSEPV